MNNIAGPNTFNENETIAKYEIMDGAPVRGIVFDIIWSQEGTALICFNS